MVVNLSGSTDTEKGHHRVHGARSVFKEPETWGVPDEVIEVGDHWG